MEILNKMKEDEDRGIYTYFLIFFFNFFFSFIFIIYYFGLISDHNIKNLEDRIEGLDLGE